MRTTRDIAQRNRVTVKWADDKRTTRTLHFLVRGPRGGTRAGLCVRLEDLFAELAQLGVWAMIGIPVKGESPPVLPNDVAIARDTGLAFRITNHLLNAGVIVEGVNPVGVQELVQECLRGVIEA